MTRFTDSSEGMPVSLIFGGMSPEHSASRASFSFVYEQLSAENSGVNLQNIYYVDMENRVACHSFNNRLEAKDYMRSHRPMNYAAAAAMMMSDPGYLFNLLHGNFGEDGHIQGLSKLLNLRGTFGEVLPSSLAMSKIHMQRYVAGSQPGVTAPATLVLSDASQTSWDQLTEAFGKRRVVVKPNSLGASLFTECYRVSQGEQALITENLRAIFEFDERALVQEFVAGTEYSIGCIHHKNEVLVLPAARIDTSRGFFGYEEKHRLGQVEETLLDVDTPEIAKLKQVSKALFEDLGFAHMCRFDYIVTPQNDLYFLEANPIPGLMKNSILPKMLKQAGISLSNLIRGFSAQDASRARKRSTYEYSED